MMSYNIALHPAGPPSCASASRRWSPAAAGERKRYADYACPFVVMF